MHTGTGLNNLKHGFAVIHRFHKLKLLQKLNLKSKTNLLNSPFFLQVIDNGVILHKGSYFRDMWNCTDALVVCCAIASMVLEWVDLDYKTVALRRTSTDAVTTLLTSKQRCINVKTTLYALYWVRLNLQQVQLNISEVPTTARSQKNREIWSSNIPNLRRVNWRSFNPIPPPSGKFLLVTLIMVLCFRKFIYRILGRKKLKNTQNLHR